MHTNIFVIIAQTDIIALIVFLWKKKNNLLMTTMGITGSTNKSSCIV